jgi:hypothetical protein
MIIGLEIEHKPGHAGKEAYVLAGHSTEMRDVPDAVMRWFFGRFALSSFDYFRRVPDDSMHRQTIWEREGFRFTWEWLPNTRNVSFCLLTAPVNRTGFVFAMRSRAYGRDLYVQSLTGTVRFYQSALLFALKDAANAHWREQKGVPFDDANTLPDASDWAGLRIDEVPVAADELLHASIPVTLLDERKRKHATTSNSRQQKHED